MFGRYHEHVCVERYREFYHLSGVKDPLLNGNGHGMGPARCVKLLHDIADMELDRSFTDSQDRRRLPAALTLLGPF